MCTRGFGGNPLSPFPLEEEDRKLTQSVEPLLTAAWEGGS